MKISKMDLLTRCEAGAGYDISASTANATPQAANQSAGTVFNFGSGKVDSGTQQSATPTANATAARNAGDNALSGPTVGSDWHKQIDWPMVAIIGVAVVAFGFAIYHVGKKGTL